MDKPERKPFSPIDIIVAVVLLASLFLSRMHGYLLFHGLSEVFSVAIAGGIFMLAWAARKSIDNGSLLFLGAAYLFVGIFDLIHMLAYKGMGVFQSGGTDLPTQLWITARYLESISLFIAPFFARKRVNMNAALGGFASLSTILAASIFYWKVFPACFTEGSGLTSFKIYSEYVISTFLAASVFLIIRKKSDCNSRVRVLLLSSVILTIISEFAFTLYSGPYDTFNALGHYLKILSFYFIYKAVIHTAVVDPSQLLFHNLSVSADSFRTERDRLYSILDSMPDGVTIINSSCQMEYANPAMEKIYSPLKKGIKCHQYIHARETECEGCKLKEVISGKTVRNTVTDNKGRIFDAIETPLYNPDNTVSKLEIFREMTEFHGMVNALENSEKKYRSMFENMLDGFALHEIITNEKGKPVDYRFLEVNASFERLTGLKREEITGRTATEVIPGISNDPADWIGSYGRVALECEELKVEQYSVNLQKWFSVSAYSFKRGTFCTIFEEITERKNAELKIQKLNKELQQQANELSRAVQELESFSYSVSHDLRAPIRAIVGFSDILKEDYGYKLDKTACSYIDRIQNAGKRMDQLIQDLLNLSRVSRHQLNFDEADLSAAAKEFVDDLKTSDQDRNVTFKIQDNMIQAADISLMRQVIENLLRNAWKYSSRKEAATIEFGRAEEGNESVFFVRDNGAGFDSRFADKLFQPFSRLHSDTEFKGTGIGLAIVKRIVERHGGRVWAESVLNEGAVFYFTLPRNTETEAINHH